MGISMMLLIRCLNSSVEGLSRGCPSRADESAVKLYLGQHWYGHCLSICFKNFNACLNLSCFGGGMLMILPALCSILCGVP